MSDRETAENDAFLAEIARQGREITRLSAGSADREMKAFVAGWFAHAQNPKDAPFLVEDAWHAYRLVASAERVISPAVTEGVDDE